MALISAFAPLNYLGCISATLSSALSEFVSCPALLKVIAADKLYPYYDDWFYGQRIWKIKTTNKRNRLYFSPIPGFCSYRYISTKKRQKAKFCLTNSIFKILRTICLAKLDTIALLISDFFLATFALMNFATFHVSLIKPIGWRPTFKVIVSIQENEKERWFLLWFNFSITTNGWVC